MAVTQYIGARYVPVFADPAEWSSAKQYEPLTIVLHEGNSYTSRQFVPIGVDIDNTDFWAETGNYNAQVEAYRQEVLQLEEEWPVWKEETKEYLDANLSAKPYVFNTVAEMQSFGQFVDNDICITLGFTTKGDLGGAVYIIGSEGIPNAMDVLACGDKVATLILTKSYITPQTLGYVSGSPSCDTIFDRMVYLSNSLYFPTGTYIFSTSHLIDLKPMSIFGDGIDRTFIEYRGISYMLWCRGNSLTCSYSVKDIHFKGLNSGNDILTLSDSWNSSVHSCRFDNAANAITLKNSKSWTEGTTIEDCMFRACVHGIKFSVENGGDGVTSSFFATVVRNCAFSFSFEGGHARALLVGVTNDHLPASVYSGEFDIVTWNERGGDNIAVSVENGFISGKLRLTSDGLNASTLGTDSYCVSVNSNNASRCLLDFEYAYSQSGNGLIVVNRIPRESLRHLCRQYVVWQNDDTIKQAYGVVHGCSLSFRQTDAVAPASNESYFTFTQLLPYATYHVKIELDQRYAEYEVRMGDGNFTAQITEIVNMFPRAELRALRGDTNKNSHYVNDGGLQFCFVNTSEQTGNIGAMNVRVEIV